MIQDLRPPQLVYLAGPIFGQPDSVCRDWRRLAALIFGQDRVLDPMRRDMRGKEDIQYKAIVEADKADIEAAYVVLAYCPTASVGTSMEVFYAHSLKVAVVAVVEGPVSPWLRYHAVAIFADLLPAYEYVLDLLNRRV